MTPTRWTSAWTLAWLTSLAAAQDEVMRDDARDLTGDGRVVVELAADRAAYFAGETISVRLRLVIESTFARTNLIQMFRQKLDVPVQLVVPWIEDLPGAFVVSSTRAAPGVRLALNDDVADAVALADREIDGKRFEVVEIERRYAASRAGELAIPAPIARFAFATRFEDDFVSGPVAKDRVDAFVRGSPLALTIRPLPEAGRPAEFTGAIGRFSCWTEARPAVVELGGSLKLVLSIEGEGNLDRFDAPRLDDLAGFTVHGVIDDKSPARRTITYDLAPRHADITAVPGIPFAFFDVGPPPQYRLVHTSPIPIVVQRPAIDAPTDERRAPPPPVRTDSSSRAVWIGVGVVALILLARRARRTRA